MPTFVHIRTQPRFIRELLYLLAIDVFNIYKIILTFQLTCRIGERKLGHNLLSSVLTCGSEVRGWNEYEEIEGTQEKYLKWLFVLDREMYTWWFT